MRTGSDQVLSRKTAAAFSTVFWALVWTPSFISTGHFSSHLSAQEERLETADDASEGETLEKKRPEKLLLKKVLEKKTPEGEGADDSGLSADDLFGIGELDGDEVEALVDEVEAPTV